MNAPLNSKINLNPESTDAVIASDAGSVITTVIQNLRLPIDVFDELVNSETPSVMIFDAVMGSGKTTFVMNKMEAICKANYNAKFLFVSPFLTEVGDPDGKCRADRIGRIGKACPSADFKRPERKPTKRSHFSRLINAGENIACTHKSFELMSNDTAEALAEQGYTIVIDEALEVVQLYSPGNTGDIQIVKDYTEVDPDTHAATWVGPQSSRFEEVISLCAEGRLFCFKDNFLVWELPPALLLRNNVLILTYQFKSSIISAWLDVHNMQPRYANTDTLGLQSEATVKAEARDLITIVEDNYTKKLGRCLMSATGYRKMDSQGLRDMRLIVEGMCRRTLRVKSKELIWCCYKGQRKELAGKGYSRSFVSCNARATNAFAEREVGIYLVDRYPHTSLQVFMQARNAPLNAGAFALAEMLQWIWRTRIRNSQPIRLVIPSQRMRNLLQGWLEIPCT